MVLTGPDRPLCDSVPGRLRRHGAPSFPDPKYTPDPGGSFVLSFSASTCHLNEASPVFRAAVQACPSSLGGSFMIAFIHAQQEAGAACAQ